MTMSLGKGLAIAAGLGAVGIGGMLMFKGNAKAKEAEPADTGATPGATTGATPGMPGVPGASPAVPGAQATPSAGSQLQGEQMGPYTVVKDASGMSVVFETATQQPVGVVDAQGNIQPITVDAQGNMALAPQQAQPTTASVLGGPQIQAPVPGAVAASPQVRSAAYDAIAADLFANAIDPSIGSAQSDSIAGAATLGARPQPATEQVGEFTLVADGSGSKLVVETATQQPVGLMDAAGNITPINVDANGTASLATAPTPVAQPVP